MAIAHPYLYCPLSVFFPLDLISPVPLYSFLHAFAFLQASIPSKVQVECGWCIIRPDNFGAVLTEAFLPL
eukprot:scaffold76551_cov17-Tisochrysis_lutea.AAC.1